MFHRDGLRGGHLGFSGESREYSGMPEYCDDGSERGEVDGGSSSSSSVEPSQVFKDTLQDPMEDRRI